MNYRVKAFLGSAIEVLGFLGALYGLLRVYRAVYASSGTAFAMAILLVSVAIGSFGVIVARYSGARAKNNSEPERLALEALAKAQQQLLKAKKQK
jgi:hypothetical protein